jgi:hypothetical protein
MHRRRSRLGRKVGQELLEKRSVSVSSSTDGSGIFQHKTEQCHQQVDR